MSGSTVENDKAVAQVPLYTYVLFFMIIVIMLMIHHPRGNELMKSKATMTFRAVGFLKKIVFGYIEFHLNAH